MDEQLSVTPTDDEAQNGGLEEAAVTDADEPVGGTDSGEDTSSQPSIDWDTEDNPYKKRFTGLQKTVQERTEENQRLRAELQRLQAMQVQQALEELPEDERNYALNELRRQYEATLVRSELAEVRNQAEQLARERVIDILSERYGVPRDELAEFDTPRAMERYAQKMSELRKQQRAAEKKAERKESYADRFEGSVPRVKKPVEKAKDLRGAKMQFQEAMLHFLKKGKR